MSYDLLIRNGAVVDTQTIRHFDLAISGERISALLPPGSPAEAPNVLDAAGRLLLPGLVDAHVHLREPGLVYKEGFASGTRAAAAGGVTTVMVMPTDDPLTLTPEDFIAKRELAEGAVYVDFALQAALGPNPNSIRALRDLGAVSFEVFLADVASDLLVADAERLLTILAAASAEGAIVGVTPGDHDVISSRTSRMKAIGSGLPEDYPASRPPVSEALGVAKACVAARETGAKIHLRQISARSSADLVRLFRGAVNLTCEVTPHNLILDERELSKQGPFAKMAPPLRPKSDVEAVRSALRDGAIDIVATDHAPHLPAEKLAGLENIWLAPGGVPGLQTMLPAMLSLVDAGAITLNSLVRVCCAEPARIFGLGNRKGTLREGADADIVVLDPLALSTVARADQLSKAQSTPFEGLTCRGAITHVFLRGREVFHQGEVLGRPSGRFLAP
jgi:dihydroorotase